MDCLGEEHAKNLWQHMIRNPTQPLEETPFKALGLPMKKVPIILEQFVKFTTKIVERNESSRGDTVKLLVELQDGHRVETVVMKHVKRVTVCLSSQIGCAMGCRFCATGTMGIIGDLTCGEIIEQFMHARSVALPRNVVYMGMGEPLNNYENVLDSLHFMLDTKRFCLAAKHITVSTVGVVKNMYRLSDEIPEVNIALSLHAPTQETRLKIVPAAAMHNINKLMEAVDYYIAANEKRKPGSVDPKKRKGVMIEYILIQDINDTEEHAHQLGNLLMGRREHLFLNLIPYNPTDVCEDYKPPTRESVERFQKILMSDAYEVQTRIRVEMGQDIAGACGQLALVKPGKEGEVDIEDIVGVSNRKKIKAVRGKSNSSSSPSPSKSTKSTSSSSNQNNTLSNFFQSSSFLYLLTSAATVSAVAWLVYRRGKIRI